MPPILSFHFHNSEPDVPLVKFDLYPAVTTLDQASNSIPAGAYTTFRTYQKTSALHFCDHIARLVNSARLAGYPIHLDELLLRKNVREAILHHPGEEVRVRLTIPFVNLLDVIYIFVDALTVPTTAQRQDGARTLTRKMQRDNPSAKLSTFIQSSGDTRNLLKGGYEEVLMVGEKGSILEGLSSNFYAVVAGEIWTAGEGVLSGITREVVLAIAAEHAIPVHLDAKQLADLPEMQEAFITSTSRAVLPVVEIDNKPVAGGKPGPITQKLMTWYDQQVLREIAPI